MLLQALAPKALALLAAYLLVQVIRFIIKRCHAHKTFERMKIVGPRPSFIHGNLRDFRRGTTMNFIDQMHEKYGKTVGIYLGADPFILTKDPRLIQEVFVQKNRNFYDRAPIRPRVEPLPHHLLNLRGERWRYIRKLLTPAFTSSKVSSDQFYRDTHRTLERFISQLDRNSELVEGRRETFVEDLYDRMVACAVDVIVQSLFHLNDIVSFESPLRSDGPKTSEKSLASMKDWIMGSLGIGPTLRGDAFLKALKETFSMTVNPVVDLTFCFPELEKPLTFLCNHLYLGPMFDLFFKQIDFLTRQNKVAEKGEKEGEERRIIDTLLEALRERKITMGELKGNALMMVFAGFETTAHTLAFALWLLAKYPHVQLKVRNELVARMSDIAADKNAGDLSQAELGELVASCEYLRMVINETLRLYPPAHGITIRQADADCTLADGTRIERGVAVMASLFTIQRDETLWGRNAHLFEPERFEMLDASQLNSPMFMPFGIGHRSCIGKMLALQEMKIIIGRLLLDYSVELQAGKSPEELRLISPTGVSMTCADKISLKFVKIRDN